MINCFIFQFHCPKTNWKYWFANNSRTAAWLASLIKPDNNQNVIRFFFQIHYDTQLSNARFMKHECDSKIVIIWTGESETRQCMLYGELFRSDGINYRISIWFVLLLVTSVKISRFLGLSQVRWQDFKCCLRLELRPFWHPTICVEQNKTTMVTSICK